MEKITLKKQNGHFVSCVARIPEECKGIVIAVHGFSSSKECDTYRLLLRRLPEAGLGMFGIELPGHGKEESHAETLRVESCLDSIAEAEKYVSRHYPALPLYYFGSSFGAYVIGLYLSTREHTGRKAFFRSGAVNMPELFIKENPTAGEQEKIRQLEEKGFYDLSLDDRHQPVKITRGFYDDLKANDLFEIFDPDRFGKHQVAMAHGMEDTVIDPKKAGAFAERFHLPIRFFEREGHSLGSSLDTPDQVADLAIRFFMDETEAAGTTIP